MILYNPILCPQNGGKSRGSNGQKYSRRRQNDTPYSPLPGQLRRRLYFEPHLTCGSLPRPRARARPRDAARPAARCRSGWHGGMYPLSRSGFGQIISDLWCQKRPNNSIYNYVKMVCQADFSPYWSFSCSNNIHESATIITISWVIITPLPRHKQYARRPRKDGGHNPY